MLGNHFESNWSLDSKIKKKDHTLMPYKKILPPYTISHLYVRKLITLFLSSERPKYLLTFTTLVKVINWLVYVNPPKKKKHYSQDDHHLNPRLMLFELTIAGYPTLLSSKLITLYWSVRLWTSWNPNKVFWFFFNYLIL